MIYFAKYSVKFEALCSIKNHCTVNKNQFFGDCALCRMPILLWVGFRESHLGPLTTHEKKNGIKKVYSRLTKIKIFGAPRHSRNIFGPLTTHEIFSWFLPLFTHEIRLSSLPNLFYYRNGRVSWLGSIMDEKK